MTAAARPDLRLTVYDAVAGEDGMVPSGPACRFVYALAAELIVETDGGALTIQADDGAFVQQGSRLKGSGLAWIYEVAPVGLPFLAGAEVVRSQVLRPAFGRPCLIRADRIESPPGAVTPRHGHRGPGMRRLVYGRLLAEVGETVERIEAGHAWFETGADMVVGANIGDTNAAFVRVMLLPMELEGGKSSFMPENEREAAKPRAVSARLFGEITLPEILA